MVDADTIPHFPSILVNPCIARSIIVPSHRPEAHPFFHRQSHLSRCLSPTGIASIASRPCLQALHRRARFRFSGLPLSCFVFCFRLPPRLDQISIITIISSYLGFPCDRPRLTPLPRFPFVFSVSFHLLDSIASDMMLGVLYTATITSNIVYCTVLYGPRPTVPTTPAASHYVVTNLSHLGLCLAICT